MMLHRHFENGNSDNMTRFSDVSLGNGSSDTTNPNDPLYIPVPKKEDGGEPPSTTPENDPLYIPVPEEGKTGEGDEPKPPEDKPSRRGRPKKEG